MPYLADRVQETTSTTGTGTVTLAGAVAGYQSFATGFAGDLPCLVGYLIVSGTAWEVGKGVINAVNAGATTLTRTDVKSSSNANALISLTGTSNVFCTASAELLDNANIGLQLAQQRGFALP
jgi:hypothetical protein